ncbi:MAG: hypothetical protein LBC98_04755 [Prevotellaceae bacterium]|nr:hypothetical protein [Prevotellaceae bacterium]
MTSLFFVMLVLFVLTIALPNQRIKELEATNEKLQDSIKKLQKELVGTEEQLAKIKDIEESIKNIDPNYFEYNSAFKRHTLKDISVSFKIGSADIYDISGTDRNRLITVGKSIRAFVDRASEKTPDVQYLLIIEGQSSKFAYSRNYELSYERALALVRYWEEQGISFNDKHCEIIISGSGDGSPFRDPIEILNQRFVIHIIPKPGIIENNKIKK